ncbi:MAG TPA: protein kinase [Gemmatimonadaceae bacterium]|nr:protein kinase [Gemmatimonadaceae bacterium]
MTSGKGWDELENLFNATRDLSPQERESLLRERSPDVELRNQLDDLLRAHDALEVSGSGGFLESLDTARAALLLDVASIDGPDAAMLSPGDTVGRYRIVRPIGRGGMGVIYLASDSRLNRSVALKLLASPLSVDSNARRRFEEEARAASLLDHPNIATVYEVDETADGQLFIAMAFYDGETLRDKLQRGPLPVTDVLRFAIQVADGLNAAHAAGLVHRDIKPGNVIVTSQGVAKIVDFGIARVATDEITQTGATAGTVAYMSPEQTQGAPPHPGMDVWSLGVMLYEMLTGVRPFRGDSSEVVIFAIRNDQPQPIDQLNRAGVPQAWTQVVAKCLRKNPAERYADAGEILNELKKLGESAPAKNSSTWLPRYFVVAAIVALVIVIVGAVWFRGRNAPMPSAGGPHSIAVLPFENQQNATDDDHFSAGFADELITALGAVPGLKVAAGQSTFALYESGLDENAIAARLGVTALLEGSVKRDSARLRITARLVQPRDHAVLWSEVYDVSIRNVFDVQEQIARSIADALNLRLASTSGDSLLVARPTADLEAYDLYLRGRHVRIRATGDRLEQALAYFRGAIERDPGFANAYSGLAETYVNLANFGFVSPAEGFANANIAAERALALNPRLAEAHVSHAYVLASEREFGRAESAFRRALSLNPSFALGHHYYSLLLAMLNRTDEALDQNRRARELDPLLTPAAADYGIILCQRNELDAAGNALSSALALEPNFALTLYWLGAVRAAEGANPEARKLLEQAARASPNYPGVPGALAYTYAHSGNQRAADSVVSVLKTRATNDRARANLAFAYGALGRLDEAFSLMQQVNWDVPTVIELRADPLLRPLRADPRYLRVDSDIVRSERAAKTKAGP